MKKDIENREDIKILINQFYNHVKRDSIIGFYFTEVMKVNWDKHLPIMYVFWENILFHTGQYSGNPMQLHQQLHKKYAIEPKHFERWLHLFIETADELFKGDNTEQIKQRATSIATVMQIKILNG